MTDADTLAAAKAAMLSMIEDLEIEKNELTEEVEEKEISKEDSNKVSEDPDYPCCDYCGEEFAGKFFCSQCRSAFYCSKECQKKHWKASSNGHKGDCTKMEEICQIKAGLFICVCDEFFGVTGVERDALLQKLKLAFDGLGENGPYEKAIELGLNEYLLQLFMFEIRDVKQRFQRGLYISTVVLVLCSLFRGKRNIPTTTFDCIDGHRVRLYLRSNDRAFESWFAASLQVIETFQSQGLDAIERNDLHSFSKIQKLAHIVADCWMYVFANKKAAKAILLGSSKEVDDAAKERALWIVTQMKAIITNFSCIIKSLETSELCHDSAANGRIWH